MKIAIFDAHRFEQQEFAQANEPFGYSLKFFETRLNADTARLAAGCDVVCAFVNDRLDLQVVTVFKELGIKLIALRSAGFNHVDLKATEACGIKVVRVPAYSPHAVAEHAVLLIQALNRKICRANARVRDHNFSLDGLVGFDLFGKTVGIIGTGQIGAVFARIMHGFGCRILAYDNRPNVELSERLGIEYVSLAQLYKNADIISLHLPLSEQTHYLINAEALDQMKSGCMLINTSRGGLVDTNALIAALKSGHLSAAGLDVYEEEENYFFRDLSEQIMQDDTFARLLTFPNVLITAHQAFLTHEAIANIVGTTLKNIQDFETGKTLQNEVKSAP